MSKIIVDEESRKVRVSFDDKVLQVSTLSVANYTQAEIDSYWLSVEDMDKISDRLDRIALRIESGKKARLGSTYRGLENITREGQTEYVFNIQDCVEAVLLEQDRQYSEGIHNDALIAEASMQYTRETLMKALDRGISDAKEAKHAHERLEHHRFNSFEDSSSSLSCTEEITVPILKTGTGVHSREDSEFLGPAFKAMKQIS